MYFNTFYVFTLLKIPWIKWLLSEIDEGKKNQLLVKFPPKYGKINGFLMVLTRYTK